jgi:transcriptional regulator with XRE-family HTH domain
MSQFTVQERAAFGKLLQRTLVEKGMTASELARKASILMPNGKKIGRDVIARYTSGRSIPTPINLKAIAAALGVDPNLMIPRDYAQRPGHASEGSTVTPPRSRDVRVSTTTDGLMNLMVNVHLPRQVGWKIAEMIESEMKKMDEAGDTPPRR